MLKHIEKEDNNKIIEETDKLIVLDFFAQWCMPCKMFSPIFEKLGEKYPQIDFYKIDIDENRELVTEYSIESVPTIIFIKNGRVVNQEIGVRSEKEMDNLINKYI